MGSRLEGGGAIVSFGGRMLKVYAYSGCSTCKNAIKWLKSRKISFKEIAIRETPPSVSELRIALAGKSGEIRTLFNVSGQDYRALGLKDELPQMADEAALKLLSGNGNLVKRPLVIDEAAGISLVGFREEEWGKVLG